MTSLPLHTLQPLRQDVIQVTVPFVLAELEPEDFACESLVLPFALRYAVKKRQIEFLCGRYCMRLCCRALGLELLPEVGLAEDRSPIWPPHLVGSISHTEGWASAVVGLASTVTAIGLDIEHCMLTATSQISKHICTDAQELPRIVEHLGCSREVALTLIFSAKESLYKATFSRVKRYFGFHSARVIPHQAGTLAIELTTDLTNDLPQGHRWPVVHRFLDHGLIETLILETKSNRPSP